MSHGNSEKWKLIGRGLFRRHNTYWYRIWNPQTGLYLHASGEGWTSEEAYRYLGSARQVENLADVSKTLADYKGVYQIIDVTDSVRGKKRSAIG